MKKIIALLGALASASSLWSVASAQEIPSYARPSSDDQIHGRIASVNGAFNITLHDDRGYMDNVDLHQGTVINPIGLSLAPGMRVTIVGTADGKAFDAEEIDAPYEYGGPAPVPVYYGPGWWYPGFAYGYGPYFYRTPWRAHWWGPGPRVIRR
jgi:hypothetical protein